MRPLYGTIESTARGTILLTACILVTVQGIAAQEPVVDAITRELTTYRPLDQPQPADAVTRECTLFRSPGYQPATDAITREFTVFSPGSDVTPTDACTREYTLRGPDPGGLAEGMPERFMMVPPRPNPFTGATTFSFGLPKDAPVSLSVFDVSGRLVRAVLANELRAAGWHRVEVDASGWGTGMYFYWFRAADFHQRGRLVIER